MKQFVAELFSETGSVSMMRLMSLIALIVGSVIAIYGIYMGKDLAGVAEVAGVFVGSAFAAKTTQKFMEK